ncbi:MAG: hypothetical protein WCK96_12425 [Methylococcales bacterium]
MIFDSRNANHISVLRTKAKQLQQQAAAELAHAKQHVEQLSPENNNASTKLKCST